MGLADPTVAPGRPITSLTNCVMWQVRITDANAQTLRGVPLYRTNIADYAVAQSQKQGQNVQHACAL
jgi:hypothetical protein